MSLCLRLRFNSMDEHVHSNLRANSKKAREHAVLRPFAFQNFIRWSDCDQTQFPRSDLAAIVNRMHSSFVSLEPTSHPIPWFLTIGSSTPPPLPQNPLSTFLSLSSIPRLRFPEGGGRTSRKNTYRCRQLRIRRRSYGQRSRDSPWRDWVRQVSP